MKNIGVFYLKFLNFWRRNFLYIRIGMFSLCETKARVKLRVLTCVGYFLIEALTKHKMIKVRKMIIIHRCVLQNSQFFKKKKKKKHDRLPKDLQLIFFIYLFIYFILFYFIFYLFIFYFLLLFFFFFFFLYIKPGYCMIHSHCIAIRN